MKRGRNGLVKIVIAPGETFASTLAQHPEIDEVPLEKRSTGFLKQTCIHRGLHVHSSRVTMIARLRNPEQAVTVALTKTVVQKAPREFYSAHQSPPVYAQGKLGLHGLPHEVLRSYFRRVRTEDLFALLYVSRYVSEDALHVLIQRSIARWGPNASPKAYSYALLGNAHAVRVEHRIRDYGSMEGYEADLKRRKLLKVAQKQEQSLLLKNAPARFEHVKQLFARHQLPLPCIYVEGKGCQTSLLYVVIDEKFYSRGLRTLADRCKPYVNRQQPANYDAFFMREFQRIEKRSAVRAYQILLLAQPHLNIPKNRTRDMRKEEFYGKFLSCLKTLRIGNAQRHIDGVLPAVKAAPLLGSDYVMFFVYFAAKEEFEVYQLYSSRWTRQSLLEAHVTFPCVVEEHFFMNPCESWQDEVLRHPIRIEDHIWCYRNYPVLPKFLIVYETASGNKNVIDKGLRIYP